MLQPKRHSLTTQTQHIRLAFVMGLKPGQAEEYARRHKQIWPELATVLKAHGAHNYSIFYSPTTRSLFAYVEIEDKARWKAISQTVISKRWRKYMSEIIFSNPDHSPITFNMIEMLHLD